MGITINQRKLSKRTNQIRKLLSNISDRIAVQRATTSPRGVVIFAAFSGSSPLLKKYNDWTFNLKNNYIKGSYSEIWEEHGQDFLLIKAYFKLLEFNFEHQIELLSLHSDPQENSLIYKKSPHIHIKHPSNNIISKAHIALNLNNLDVVLSSIEMFEDSFKKSLDMINYEIINNL